MIYEMASRKERLGADGYVLLHNHPSGNPELSADDLQLASNFKDHLPGFMGAMVITTGRRFGWVGPRDLGRRAGPFLLTEPNVRIGTMKAQGAIPRERGYFPEWLEIQLGGPAAVQEVGRGVLEAMREQTLAVRQRKAVLLIYQIASGQPTMLEYVPRKLFQDVDALGAHVRGRARDVGAQAVFAYTTDSRLNNAAAAAMHAGHFQDVIIDSRAWRERWGGVRGLYETGVRPAYALGAPAMGMTEAQARRTYRLWQEAAPLQWKETRETAPGRRLVRAELEGTPYTIHVREDRTTTLRAGGETVGTFRDLEHAKTAAERMILTEFPQATGGEGPPRGGIAGAPGGTVFNIKLFASDRSTLLHETGHFFLEVLGHLAQDPAAPASVRADYATALQWLGFATHQERIEAQKRLGAIQERKSAGEALSPEDEAFLAKTTHAHEEWARAWEKYFMEGKAPTVELAPAFARYRVWLTQVYGKADVAGVEIAPEIRDVFDRMFAADDEIARASDAQGYEAVPGLEKTASPGELAELARLQDAAKSRAEDQLRGLLMASKRRELEAWFKKDRDAIEAEVKDALAQDPINRALWYLQRGELLGPAGEIPEGLKDPTGKPLKLSRQVLVERYGEDLLRSLPRPYVYSRTGGLDPEVVAPFFGFPNGEALLKALQEAPDFASAVRVETQKRMTERYGDLLNEPAKLLEAAMQADHNEPRLDQLLLELRLMARASGKETGDRMPLDRVTLREKARETIAILQLGRALPHVYQRAEASHRRLALEHARAGRLGRSWDEQALAVWNHALYREAVDARTHADAAIAYLRRMGTDAQRGKLGRAGTREDPEYYLRPVDDILDRFDFRPIPQVEVARRQSLREWIANEEAEGRDPALPERLRDEAFRKSWREMSYQELMDVRDAVANIQHLAKLKNGLVKKGKILELDTIRGELIGAIEANLPDRGPILWSEGAHNALERGIELLRVGDAALLRPEELIRRMDGGKIDGPWTRYLWEAFVEAENAENDLMLDVTQKIVEAVDRIPAEKRKKLDKEYFVESLGQYVTFENLLAVALNMGNDSNYRKLLEGRPRDVKNWDVDVLEDMVKHLDREDWAYVQDMWNILEGLWPRIADLERRLTGLEPPKVERRPFLRTFEDGTQLRLEGGYYPVKYSGRYGGRAGRLQTQSAGDTFTLFDHHYARAATPHGHVMARIEEYSEPIRCELSVLPAHIVSVIHDLTHREALLNAYKILTDEDLAYTMKRYLGEPYSRAMLDWLRGIANDRNHDLSNADHWMINLSRWGRRNNAVMAMGLKFTVALQNFANYFNALEQVKGRYLNEAFVDFYADRGKMVDFIHEKSGQMKHRFNSLERDVREQILKLIGKHTLSAQAQRFAFYGIAMTDAAIAYPAWLGAYKQALAEGHSDELAASSADRVVRLALGAGGEKDLPGIQRNHELLKWVTMFYSFFNVTYNRGRAIGSDTRMALAEGRMGREWPHLLARTFFLWIAPALVAEWLSGRGPDDDETWARWIARKTILYPFLTVPLIREMATGVEAKITGGYARDIKYGGLASVAQEITNAFSTDIAALAGEGPDMDVLLKRNLRVAGYASGLPLTQPLVTGEYLWDVATGDEDPDNFWELGRNLMYARRPGHGGQ